MKCQPGILILSRKEKFHEKTKNFRVTAAGPDMLAHYKILAEESGISVSRLIYLRLRSKKKSIVIVGRDMLNAVKELKNLVQSLIQGKPIDADVADSLIRYSHFLEKFVALDNANEEIVVGGGRRGN